MMKELAISYLNADVGVDYCKYTDDATRETYVSRVSELKALGEALAADTPDAYSLWCAETESLCVPTESAIEALRWEAGNVGDVETARDCAACVDDIDALARVARIIDATARESVRWGQAAEARYEARYEARFDEADYDGGEV